MSTGFVFPGQGSQAVGMGRALAEAFGSARLVFEEIDDALGQRLSRLMFEGPEARPDPDRERPAGPDGGEPGRVLAVLESEGGFKLSDKAAFVAGHSLGEYTALAAAGALSLPDAARLLKRRGLAMQRAVPVGAGAMAALLGLDLPVAEEVAAAAAEGEVCACANDNAPGQVVVSGDQAAVERAIIDRRRKGRQAQHHAAGQRALPLRADGSRPRARWKRPWPRPISGRRRSPSSPMSPRHRSATRRPSAASSSSR